MWNAPTDVGPRFLPRGRHLLLFFFTLVTGPRRSLSLKLSDIKVYEPQIRARLGNHVLPSGLAGVQDSRLRTQ